jgi:hypothetical protein
MKILSFIIAALVSTTCLLAQEKSDTNNWSGGTALTLPAKRLELKLSELSSYGITDKVEISARPLLFWLMPQVKVKISLAEKNGYIFASEHQLNYPTMFLNLVSRKGIGGLISPEFNFPGMISLYNGIVVSHKISDKYLLTGKAGFLFAIGSGSVVDRSTMDFPLLYPRFDVYYHHLVLMPGIDFRGKINKSFGFKLNAESFIIPGTSENFFFENRGYLTLTRKTRLQLQAGYLLCYGKYPFGTQWHLLPALEIVKGF